MTPAEGSIKINGLGKAAEGSRGGGRGLGKRLQGGVFDGINMIKRKGKQRIATELLPTKGVPKWSLGTRVRGRITELPNFPN
jgi:hypothetical protein